MTQRIVSISFARDKYVLGHYKSGVVTHTIWHFGVNSPRYCGDHQKWQEYELFIPWNALTSIQANDLKTGTWNRIDIYARSSLVPPTSVQCSICFRFSVIIVCCNCNVAV